MQRITIKRARTWHCRRMRHYVELSNGLAPSSQFRSWLDCIINTSGCNFRKGQVSLGSGAGARERQNLKAIIQTCVSRNDSPVLELNHVDSDSPRFAGDVDHMRRPAFPSSGWAPVPDGDKRHFWGVRAESQLQHPAVAALPLVCARALKPLRKSRRVAELQRAALRRNQREEARAPVVQILEGLC